MNYKYLLILLSLIIISCSNEEISPENLIFQNGLAYLKNSEKLFTGFSVSNKNGKFIINYKEGQRDGLTKRYWTNSKLRLRENYTNGKRNGLHEMFYANGNIEMKIYFLNDKINGTAEWFHKNGNVSKTGIYENGNIIEIKCFEKDGKIYAPSPRGLCLN